MAGLWSPVPGVQSTILTPPSVAFPARVSTHAPRRRRPDRCPPLNAPIHRAPATTTNCLAASDRGGGAILRPVVLGPIGHCASPYPPPGRFAMFRVRHRRLCDRPQATMGSGIAHPLAPCRITNMIHTGRENANVLNCPAAVNHRRAKSRVSIETRELQLSTRECNFPGINNPTLK